MTQSGTSAIIIAAGLGSRLQPYTDDCPKCMLDFGGRTLLQRQMDIYESCGVQDITIIRGYLADKINYENVRYVENTDFPNNNILESLLYAEKELSGDIVINYSDILFEQRIVEQLLASDKDISVVVDLDWQDYYIGRSDHPLGEAENVTFDDAGRVIQIGKHLDHGDGELGEFIGMLRLSPVGAELFKEHYHKAREQFLGKPFQRAATFRKAYLTDLFQEMTDQGVTIDCVFIKKGWKEIDTVQDYTNAVRAFERAEADGD
jgi:L-glutamine-phosphate cytidylyltransferase